MGVVYRVHTEKSGRLAALKLMNSNLLSDAEAVRRFEREAKVGTSIQSEHVAHVLEAGFDERMGSPWIAFEYAEGARLDRYMSASSPLPRERALEVLRQIFRAVVAAHRARVVHRDLKPENIIVRESEDGKPHVKVLDFGVAKSLSSATAHHTQGGLGTPLWVAPEQGHEGDVPHTRSDVWALGLLTFYLLTGKNYWLRANDNSPPFDLAVELLNSPIVPASVRAAELGCTDKIPMGFDEWFLKAVNRDANLRFADALEARAALLAVLDSRHAPRHPLWLPVEIPELTEGVAVTHDANEKGLLIVSRSVLPVGSRTTVTLRIPPDSTQIYRVAARIVRVARNHDDGGGLWPYKLALVFESPIPELERLFATTDSPAKRAG